MMHKYSQLVNLDNILIEIDSGGAVTSEDIMVLLGISMASAANLLASGRGRGYLSRRNINKGSKFGGPKFEYKLTARGQKRVSWIRETKLA